MIYQKNITNINKGLAKYLINGYSTLNGAKYFAENGPQNYLVFHRVFWILKQSFIVIKL